MRSSPSAARRILAAAVDVGAEATVVPGFSRLGIALRRRLEDWQEPPSMKGQVAVVTGATSGIGLAAAVAMARLGASVHLVGRDAARGATARAAVEGAGPAPAELDLVDLSDAEAVVTLGLRLSERYEKVNVLVHNAGALTRIFKTTPAGVELTVATQVIAPYLLTATLAPLLWSSSPATIVTVSSGGMYTQRFDLARLEMTAKEYDGPVAYAAVQAGSGRPGLRLGEALRRRGRLELLHAPWLGGDSRAQGRPATIRGLLAPAAPHPS